LPVRFTNAAVGSGEAPEPERELQPESEAASVVATSDKPGTNGGPPTEASWLPPPLTPPPPSPEPLFAEPAVERPVPIEPAKSTVPGVKLPPKRSGGAALVLVGVGLLAAVGGMAIYAGLNTGNPTPALAGTNEGAGAKQAVVAPAVVDAAHVEERAEAPADLAQAVARKVEPTPTPPTTPTVAPTTTPTAATLFVDGELKGTTPTEVAVGAGKHAFVVLAEGQKMLKREVDVTPGGKIELALEPARLTAPVAGKDGL